MWRRGPIWDKKGEGYGCLCERRRLWMPSLQKKRAIISLFFLPWAKGYGCLCKRRRLWMPSFFFFPVGQKSDGWCFPSLALLCGFRTNGHLSLPKRYYSNFLKTTSWSWQLFWWYPPYIAEASFEKCSWFLVDPSMASCGMCVFPEKSHVDSTIHYMLKTTFLSCAKGIPMDSPN